MFENQYADKSHWSENPLMLKILSHHKLRITKFYDAAHSLKTTMLHMY